MLGNMKRFYKQASHRQTEDGFVVQLDGRGVKTPMGKKLAAPTAALAAAMAQEWEAQDKDILPHTMPMTQLVGTALDRVGPERPTITDQMLAFAGTDLLCYRTLFPQDLAELQIKSWQPILDWCAQELDAPLRVTDSVIAVEQPADSLHALRARLDGYDLWRLTAAQSACAAAGSLVLALAMVEGRIDGEACFDLSVLDETHQISLWGEDAEAAERRANLRGDILAAERFMKLAAG